LSNRLKAAVVQMCRVGTSIVTSSLGLVGLAFLQLRVHSSVYICPIATHACSISKAVIPLPTPAT